MAADTVLVGWQPPPPDSWQLVSPDGYLPLATHSIPLCTRGPRRVASSRVLDEVMPGLADSLPSNFSSSPRTLDIFSSIALNDENGNPSNAEALFVGGPVWALDWSPVREGMCVLCVSCHRSYYTEHKLGEKSAGSNVLQFWQQSASGFRLCFCLAHQHGDAFDLKFLRSSSSLPSSTSPGTLGILAVAFSDGTLQVWTLPRLDSLSSKFPAISQQQQTGSAPVLLSIPPSLSFSVEWPIQCIAWVTHARAVWLAGGDAAGSIHVFSIGNTPSSSLMSPLMVFPAHDTCVRGLSVHPSLPTVLASCSLDSFVKIWDLTSPFVPLFSMYVHTCTSLSWISPLSASAYLVVTSERDGVRCIFSHAQTLQSSAAIVFEKETPAMRHVLVTSHRSALTSDERGVLYHLSFESPPTKRSSKIPYFVVQAEINPKDAASAISSSSSSSSNSSTSGSSDSGSSTDPLSPSSFLIYLSADGSPKKYREKVPESGSITPSYRWTSWNRLALSSSLDQTVAMGGNAGFVVCFSGQGKRDLGKKKGPRAEEEEREEEEEEEEGEGGQHVSDAQADEDTGRPARKKRGRPRKQTTTEAEESGEGGGGEGKGRRRDVEGETEPMDVTLTQVPPATATSDSTQGEAREQQSRRTRGRKRKDTE